MNPLHTVSAVSKSLGISSRMLRYYEHIGLIQSQRTQDYAYRVYDDMTLQRLRQIIILRKLRVPVKQIREIFCNQNAISVIEAFERNISELDEEITALSTIKSILSRLVQQLQEKANMQLQLNYLGDSSVFAIVENLSFPKNTLQEDKTLNELNQANETLSKLEDKDVRILYLPPMTVAASIFSGEAEWGVGPEATGKIEAFVVKTSLLKIKPDARAMGFDCSNQNKTPNLNITPTAYEAWVSIPDDMALAAPLIKKTFAGGLYAAHVLRDWNFKRDWQLLMDWVEASEKFMLAQGEPWFEEVLNYHTLAQSGFQMDDTQIDLLLPIRKR